MAKMTPEARRRLVEIFNHDHSRYVATQKLLAEANTSINQLSATQKAYQAANAGDESFAIKQAYGALIAIRREAADTIKYLEGRLHDAALRLDPDPNESRLGTPADVSERAARRSTRTRRTRQ